LFGWFSGTRLGFGDALGLRKAEEPEGRAKVPGAWRVGRPEASKSGRPIFLLLAREQAKWNGRQTRKRVDIGGDPWKDRRTTSL